MHDWRVTDPDDPKGLIRESYRIDGITAAECRSILMDWALSLPHGQDERAALARLRSRYGMSDPAHEMNRLVAEALAGPHGQGPDGSARPDGRRGGRAARLKRDSDPAARGKG
ncbi:MAG: hypothetical protein JJU19_04720 [Pararhodobacter sp.]|nr:hypothetical protein [Pararhodobacter sp.]